jgi:glycoside/pentoside/hexuronide:cation symporter, GPH family
MTDQQKSVQLDPIKMSVILVYCLANIGMMVLDTVLDQYTVFYYAPKRLGAAAAVGHAAIQFAPIALAGLALNFGRVVDALANPIVGYLSDRTNTRWGRRIPYVLFGSIPMTVFFIMMYFPPINHSSTWNAVWFGLTCGAFLFMYTLVVAPYLALIPEIAKTSDERVKLSSFHAVASILGLIIGAVISGLLVKPFGIKWMAVVMGLFSLATILITAFCIKEEPKRPEKAVKMTPVEAVVPSLKNKHFITYAFSISSFWLGYKVLQSSAIYICTMILKKNEDYVSAVMAGMLLVLLISIPVVFYLYGKFGKKKLFMTGLFLLVIMSPLQAGVMFVGDKFGATAGVIYYHIIIALTGFPIALMMVIYNAVLSDIIDYDEKVTGFRREAMYYGMEGLFTKIARGVGSSLSGFLFAIFGLEAGRATGLLWAGPICAVFALIGVILFSRYSLTD